jgi:hypothetical protein
MFGSQIDTSIIGLYLGHNLCYKYSSESCEFILDIYVSRDFQWYEELFYLSFLDPSNHPLNIRKTLEIQISKMGAHLGMCGFIPSHFFALPKVECDSRVAFLSFTFPCPLSWSRTQG